MTSWYPFLNQWSDIWAGFMVYRTLESAALFLLVTLLWRFLRERISVQLVYGFYLLILIKLMIPTSIPWSELGTQSLLSALTNRTQEQDTDGWLLERRDKSKSLQSIPGAMIGGVSWIPEGVLGKGLSFDGGYIQLGGREDDGVLRYGPEDSFTWALWVKPDGIPQNPPMNHWAFLSRRRFQHTEDQIDMLTGYCPDGRVDIVLSENKKGGIRAYSVSTIHDGKWHHIALVRNTEAKQFHLYIDGRLETTVADRGWDLSAPCSFRIGEHGETYGGTRRFQGFMDEVRVYDYALSDQQITAAMYDTPQPLSILSTLCLVWGSVVIVLLVLQCRKEWKTFRLVQTANILDPDISPFDLQEVVKKSGISNPIRWAVSNKIHTPVVYGIFHPVIVFPVNFLHEFSPQKIQWVILHELSHIKRYDQLLLYGQLMVRALFFFHPVVYLLDAKLDECRENLSDDYGLMKTNIERSDCGECLLYFLEQPQHKPYLSSTVQGITSYPAIMKRRILLICDEQRPLQVNWSKKTCAMLMLAAAAAFAVGIHAVDAERKWNRISGDGPPARHDYAMAYDVHNQTLLLFGGSHSSVPETWGWDGRHWDKVAAAGPAPRTGARMVYDQKHEQTVLFGGRSIDGLKFYNDTWIWDHQSQQWTELNVRGPQARSGHAMTYDTARETVVLFGGKQGPFQSFDDTWEWNSKQWIKRTTQNAPSSRYNHAVAYDPLHQSVLLMGGENQTVLGDTWEWKGETRTWTQVLQQGPGTLKQRTAHAMAYDPRLRRMVLYGGHNGLHSFHETWMWDNTQQTWIKLLEGLEENARAYSGMAYDETSQSLIRFGGVDVFKSGKDQSGTWIF